MAGVFITVEGIEGVGKSTNVAYIESWLSQRQIEFISTREPGGSKLGESLRSLLLHGDCISDKAELLLMFASRAQHMIEKIEPALNENKWVICDRFTDSTYAYQGGGRSLPKHWIEQLETLVHGHRQPDLTFLLDAPVEIGSERAAKRSKADRIESESLVFFNRVRESFLQRAKQYPRYQVIDATQPLEQIQTQIEQVLEKIMRDHP